MASFFENETLMTSLTGGKPNEQRELLAWLATHAPADAGNAGARALLKPALVCLEDRSADVRKAAQDFVGAMGKAYVSFLILASLLVQGIASCSSHSSSPRH